MVRSFISPVEFRGLLPSMVVTNPRNPQVQIVVRGPSFLVSKIPAQPPVISLQLPESRADTFPVSILSEDIPLPPSVEVVAIEPPLLQITMDRSVEREVNVLVPKVGSLNSDLLMSELRVTPDKVLVSGPKKALDRIASIETEAIDLRTLQGSTSTDLALRAPSGSFQIKPDRVRVQIDVTPVLASRRFERLPIEVRAPVVMHEIITPGEVSVEVSGPRKLIQSLQRAQILPYVRISNSEDAHKELSVLVDTPKDIAVSLIEPAKVVSQSASRTGPAKPAKK